MCDTEQATHTQTIVYSFFMAIREFAEKRKVGKSLAIFIGLTLSPTALGPIGPRVFKGILLKA
jgi:hypothetical protein